MEREHAKSGQQSETCTGTEIETICRNSQHNYPSRFRSGDPTPQRSVVYSRRRHCRKGIAKSALQRAARRGETSSSNGDSRPPTNGRRQRSHFRNHGQRSELKGRTCGNRGLRAHNSVCANAHPNGGIASAALRWHEALSFSGTEPQCRRQRASKLTVQLGGLRKVQPTHENVGASDTVLGLHARHCDDFIVEEFQRAARDVEWARCQHQPENNRRCCARNRRGGTHALRRGKGDVVHSGHGDATKHAPQLRGARTRGSGKLPKESAGHIATDLNSSCTRHHPARWRD